MTPFEIILVFMAWLLTGAGILASAIADRHALVVPCMPGSDRNRDSGRVAVLGEPCLPSDPSRDAYYSRLGVDLGQKTARSGQDLALTV